jgi:hypothetical protein
MRKIVGVGGIAVSAVCGILLILGIFGIFPYLQSVYLHQSGARWLAEGTVVGLLLAAFGFWEID